MRSFFEAVCAIFFVPFICVTLFLIGCKEETGDDKAERLGLICINGNVFREGYKSKILGTGTRTLEPLNIECSNGKVLVD